MNLPYERRVEIQDQTGIVTRALLRRYEETQDPSLLNLAAGIGETADRLCKVEVEYPELQELDF